MRTTARTRTTDNRLVVPISYNYRTYDCSGSTQTATRTGGVIAGELRIMSDVVTKDFYKLQQDGVVIVNPMSSVRVTNECSGDSNEAKSTSPTCVTPLKYGYWAYNGPWGILANKAGANYDTPVWFEPQQLITPSEVDSLQSLVSTNAWAKVRGNKADLAVDLSQIGLTLSMLRRPLSTARNAASSIVDRAADRVRRGSRSSFSKADVHSIMQMLESSWLEMRFGVRPLIGSIESILELLGTPLEKMRRTARSGEILEKSQATRSVSGVGGGLEEFLRTIKDEVHVRAGILWEDEITLGRALGLDAQSIISAGWDLVPWSFVADWFANIGKALQAIVPYLTQDTLGSWIVTKHTTVETLECVNTTPVSDRVITRGSTARLVSTREAVTRSPNVPYGGISLKPKALEAIQGDLRIVDSFMLTSQLMRGKFLR